MFRPEILAPAGSLEKLRTAVRYGADAVYLAGQKFGLRSAAGNFTLSELEQGCQFAHERGAKVYIVLNGFLFDHELGALKIFLNSLQPIGIDAAIVSDLGVLETVRTHSSIPIHLSTQASTLNTHAAKFWKQLGVKRLVLGREVSIEEAANIKRDAGIEVELFVHGAMCMAFSGHCTISNYTAGRDSNRGGCVQSCRFRYKMSDKNGNQGPSGHFLSSKDLQGVSLLDQFAAGQIDSLKIEGRMKSSLYVATTTRTYRRGLDALEKHVQGNSDTFLRELDSMSHRDYTSGSLVQKPGSDSIFYHEDHHAPHTHDLAGQILEVKRGRHMVVQLKNPLVAGGDLELLATDGTNAPIDTTTMRSVAGQPLERAQPNRVVLFDDHPSAEVDLLLRKLKYVETDALSAAAT